MSELWQLFIIFARIGGLTFGGGYAMLPILQRELVEVRQWATEQELIDYYAIGQSTPGIIAINTATFVGYKRKGVIGALAATLGMVFPSLVIITTIATYLFSYQDVPWVQHAFAGIRVAVVGLIVSTVWKMARQTVKDWFGIVAFTLALAVILFFNVSPVFVILGAALIGIWRQRRLPAGPSPNQKEGSA